MGYGFEPTDVLCTFYKRVPTEGGFFYDQIHISSGRGDTHLLTAHPPIPGDLISLTDQITKEYGLYRVLFRDWLHSSWGSMNFPYDAFRPNNPPYLQIIVEEATGLFIDQVLRPEDEDDEL